MRPGRCGGGELHTVFDVEGNGLEGPAVTPLKSRTEEILAKEPS